ARSWLLVADRSRLGRSGYDPLQDSHPAIHGARLRPSLAADGPAMGHTHPCLLTMAPLSAWAFPAAARKPAAKLRGRVSSTVVSPGMATASLQGCTCSVSR